MDTKKLRQKILDLAIHGKLVPQDPNDEPASVLLERIRAEKAMLIKEGKIKAPKKSKSAGDTSHYPNQTEVDVPMGWAKCKLSDVCQFESGFAFKSESYKKEGVPLIRISNIKDGTITTDGGVCIQEVVESRFHVVKGDLLIALSGATTGKMGVYDKDDDALLNQRVGNLRVISKTCFLPEYRNLFMESQTATILEQAWGGAQPNISPNTIIGFDILLPPYAEQCRIVCKANELLALVSNIEFVQDQIETGVDDIITKVLDLAIHGKLVSQDPFDEPAINLLRRINPDFKASDNLHYEGILPSGWTLCCLEDVLDYEQPQAYIVNSTDYSDDYKTPVLTPGKSFVLGYTNELSGICNHLPVIIFDDFTTESKYVDFPFKVKSSAMKILRARGEINLKYVAVFMSITRLVGDTHKRYWISEYSKIPIPIPPLREQGRIVLAAKHLLNQLDSLIACISDN